MKNNTSKSKEHLLYAIQTLPDDFSLGEAKKYLMNAFNEIERVENKRAKREGTKLQNGVVNTISQSTSSESETAKQADMQFASPKQAWQFVGYLDKMIEEEKKTINDLAKKKPEETNIDNLFG
jgi:ATP-dependent RNA circularization protein (DNA/RNA ligase family)